MEQPLLAELEREVALRASGPKSGRLRWVVLRPRVLDGEAIAVVVNDVHLKEARDAEPEETIYLFSELVELDRCGLSNEALKKVHMVKKAFDGTIVPWDSPLGRRLRRKGLWE